MPNNKKIGIGFAVTAILFAGASVFVLATGALPSWWPMVMEIIALVAGALGFKIVFPSYEYRVRLRDLFRRRRSSNG